VTFVDCSTMKRVSMMLLVLLAMSVQAAKKNPKKKKNDGKKNAVQKYRPPTKDEIKDLVLFIASKVPGDNKCTWQGTKTGQGSVQLDTVHAADTQFFKHGKNVHQYQHLIGTSNKDGPRRSCIIWVGGNRNLFKLKRGGKIPIGPQSGAISKKFGQSPRMWRYSNRLKGWRLNHVAAHVEIQTRKKKNSVWVWESQGNWLIPTTRSSNSRAGKTCDENGINENEWETLNVGVTAIKLPHNGNSC